VTTKTTCRIASDVDLLSRVQLDEVVRLLGAHGSRCGVEFVSSEESETLKNSRALPASIERNALLMTQLLGCECDVLVLDASMLPTQMPSGLTIGALTARITPYDALISNDGCILDELPDNASVATCAMSRESQLHYYRPDLRVVRAHGSVDSILQKVRASRIDAAVIAAADLERLGKQEYVTELLTNQVCIPPAGQGALAVLVRSSEQQFREVVQAINDAGAYARLRAEWAFLEHLGVESTAPVAVLATIEDKVLELEGMVAYSDGSEKIQCMVKGSLGDEEDLGRTLASEILEAGGREVIEEFRLF
jgi:hydroxymethylbilane synthase